MFLHRFTHPRPMQKEYLGSLYFMCDYVKPKITARGVKNLGTLSRAGVPGCVISHPVVSNTLTHFLAHQVLLSMENLHARIMECIAMPFSKVSS